MTKNGNNNTDMMLLCNKTIQSSCSLNSHLLNKIFFSKKLNIKEKINEENEINTIINNKKKRTNNNTE